MLLPMIFHKKEYKEFGTLLLNAMLNAFKNGTSLKYPLDNISLDTKMKFFQDIVKKNLRMEREETFLEKLFQRYKYIGNPFELPMFKETCELDILPFIADNKEECCELHFYIQGYTQVGLLRNDTLQKYFYLMWKAIEDYDGEEDPIQLLEKAKSFQIKWAVNY